MPPSRLARILADVEGAPAPGRHLVVWVASVALLLSIIGGLLAWRSYHDRVAREAEQMAEAAADAAVITEQFFVDRTAMLAAVAGVPTIRSADPVAMQPALEALSSPGLGFGGGVGWVDLEGILRAEAGTPPDLLPVSVSDRRYVREVLARQEPFVSEVIRGRISGDPLVVVAAPTFDGEGVMNGLLVASVRIADLSGLIPVLAPATTEARVVDRAGNVVIEGGAVASLEPPANPSALERTGAVTGAGLEGDPRRVVAAAAVPTPGWVVAMEQAESRLLAGARSRFVGELAILAALSLIAIAVAAATARRLDQAHRRVVQATEDLAALDALRGAMASATTIDGVAESALAVFGEVFATEAVTIGIAGPGREGVRVWGRLEPEPSSATAVLMEAMKADRTLRIDAAGLRERALLLDMPEDHLVGTPFSGRKTAGAVAVAIESGRPRPRIRIFETMVATLGEALERAAAVEAERGASRAFQRALLPRDTIGADVPLQRAVRYLSATEVEVGGDWYDLWLLDDDRVGVVVGDVVGRGVEAAAAMGQLRSGLRAIAASAGTPQDALDRLDAFAHQIAGRPSATAIFGILDLRSGELTMASAGHLPPLVAGAAGVRALGEVKGIPIGFVTERGAGAAHTLVLEPEETVVFYTDGLVERRGEVIDEGISRLVRVVDGHAHGPVEALATAILTECATDLDDDVALVCFRRVAGTPAHFTWSTPLDGLEALWKALRRWLDAKGAGPEAAEATLAAVGEAVAVVSTVCADSTSCEVLVEVDAVGSRQVAVEHRDVALAADSAAAEAEILRRWGSGLRTPTGVRLIVPMVVGSEEAPPPER